MLKWLYKKNKMEKIAVGTACVVAGMIIAPISLLAGITAGAGIAGGYYLRKAIGGK